MPNDVSYVKVEGDNTKYWINDADAEARITAETARAEGVEGTLSSLSTSVKTSLVGAINDLYAKTLPLVSYAGMSGNTSADLLSALNAATIPLGACALIAGDGSVSRRALVLIIKTNASLGRGFVISPYAINGTTVTLGESGWS